MAGTAQFSPPQASADHVAAGAPVHRLANARKLPTQARAKDTVAAIVQAAGLVLVEQGYAGATTNKIAVRAGVSVGSLYQYFPNKDAIFQHLLHAHVSAVHAVVGEAQRELADLAVPLDHTLTRLFARLVALHDQDPELNRVLLEELPHRAAREQEHRADEFAHVAELEQVLRARPEVRLENPGVAAHLLVQTVGALSRWLGHEAPPELHRPTIIAEAVRMLTGYVQGIDDRDNGSTP